MQRKEVLMRELSFLPNPQRLPGDASGPRARSAVAATSSPTPQTPSASSAASGVSSASSTTTATSTSRGLRKTMLAELVQEVPEVRQLWRALVDESWFFTILRWVGLFAPPWLTAGQRRAHVLASWFYALCFLAYMGFEIHVYYVRPAEFAVSSFLFQAIWVTGFVLYVGALQNVTWDLHAAIFHELALWEMVDGEDPATAKAWVARSHLLDRQDRVCGSKRIAQCTRAIRRSTRDSGGGGGRCCGCACACASGTDEARVAVDGAATPARPDPSSEEDDEEESLPSAAALLAFPARMGRYAFPRIVAGVYGNMGAGSLLFALVFFLASILPYTFGFHSTSQFSEDPAPGANGFWGEAENSAALILFFFMLLAMIFPICACLFVLEALKLGTIILIECFDDLARERRKYLSHKTTAIQVTRTRAGSAANGIGADAMGGASSHVAATYGVTAPAAGASASAAWLGGSVRVVERGSDLELRPPMDETNVVPVDTTLVTGGMPGSGARAHAGSRRSSASAGADRRDSFDLVADADPDLSATPVASARVLRGEDSVHPAPSPLRRPDSSGGGGLSARTASAGDRRLGWQHTGAQQPELSSPGSSPASSPAHHPSPTPDLNLPRVPDVWEAPAPATSARSRTHGPVPAGATSPPPFPASASASLCGPNPPLPPPPLTSSPSPPVAGSASGWRDGVSRTPADAVDRAVLLPRNEGTGAGLLGPPERVSSGPDLSSFRDSSSNGSGQGEWDVQDMVETFLPRFDTLLYRFARLRELMAVTSDRFAWFYSGTIVLLVLAGSGYISNAITENRDTVFYFGGFFWLLALMMLLTPALVTQSMRRILPHVVNASRDPLALLAHLRAQRLAVLMTTHLDSDSIRLLGTPISIATLWRLGSIIVSVLLVLAQRLL